MAVRVAWQPKDVVPEQHERRIVEYLQRLEMTKRSRTSATRTWQNLFEYFLAVAEAPSPDPRLERYFHQPRILLALAETLHVPYSRTLREAIDSAAPRDPRRHLRSSYRVRELSSLGTYPNLEVATRHGWYLIRHGKPYLVSRNSPREDLKWSLGSELSDWTRHETRIAAAVSCTERGGFITYWAIDRRTSY